MVNHGRTVITFTPGSYVLYIPKKSPLGPQKRPRRRLPKIRNSPQLPDTPGPVPRSKMLYCAHSAQRHKAAPRREECQCLRPAGTSLTWKCEALRSSSAPRNSSASPWQASSRAHCSTFADFSMIFRSPAASDLARRSK